MIETLGEAGALAAAYDVAPADLYAVMTNTLFAPGCADLAVAARVQPAPITVRYLDPDTAEREFLDRYRRLQPCRLGSQA